MNILNIKEDITQVSFSEKQYIKTKTSKNQIFLHHTAGNTSGINTFSGWESNKERVATCVAICGKPKKNDKFIDGEIIQGFSSKYWAYHLGLKESTFNKFGLRYKSLDKNAIGIEICNWGQLTYKNQKFYTYVNSVVPNEEVIELDQPFRGYKYFHAYTDAQLVAVEKLLRYWCEFYMIPKTYFEDIWDVTPRALKGESGIYTHCSVRYDKIDVFPQKELVDMLKSLSQ